MLPYAALTVFHSQANARFLYDIVGDNNNVNLVCFTESNITRYEYSDILCSPTFWDCLKAPKTLIFQTDSGIRKNTILRFMEYDYIGAPWSWQIYGDTNIQIGNGGFSLRTPHIMKEICTMYRRNPHYHDKEAGEPEDILFARTLVHMNQVSLPSYDVACAFSVEHNTHPDPLGFHQAYAFHPKPLVETWMTKTDGTCASTLTLKDAWIESESGRQWSSHDLCGWLSLGIGPSGFLMPKDTLLTPVTCDVHPGTKKMLCLNFYAQGLVRVPLYQNRCKADIHVAP